VTFRERVSTAAQEGLVLGVKWGIALLAVAILILYAISDYNTVRQRAYNGQLAFEAIQRAQAQQPAPAK